MQITACGIYFCTDCASLVVNLWRKSAQAGVFNYYVLVFETQLLKYSNPVDQNQYIPFYYF